MRRDGYRDVSPAPYSQPLPASAPAQEGNVKLNAEGDCNLGDEGNHDVNVEVNEETSDNDCTVGDEGSDEDSDEGYENHEGDEDSDSSAEEYNGYSDFENDIGGVT
nr:hypothetical protein Iba_chr12eCG8080 [Ipomoea batatas]